MAFSEEVVAQAWQRAGEKCECVITAHGHIGRCYRKLVWANRGREGPDAWETHHINSQDTLSNCEILCWNCHGETL